MWHIVPGMVPIAIGIMLNYSSACCNQVQNGGFPMHFMLVLYVNLQPDGNIRF